MTFTRDVNRCLRLVVCALAQGGYVTLGYGTCGFCG